VNHADAGLPPDCRGGGSTTFASENLGEIKLRNTAFECEGVAIGLFVQYGSARNGSSSPLS